MKQFIWNTSNYEPESHKSCHIDEYLDYENCKCRKTLIDNWLKNALKMSKKSNWLKYLQLNMKVCNSFSTFYVVLFSRIFTMNI